ncbi:CU044_2847 family protein [Streptomyces sp. NPDC048258]|uniref:CU044_2847 family protein n=1 Tax=Streptomyces sp. NPDC048258 TaxID=3365527 RepID=UPI00371061C8
MLAETRVLARPRPSPCTTGGGGVVAPVARIPLEGGGYVLFEAQPTTEGPVKAGRIGDAIHGLPETLQEALGPVTEAARVTLDQLRKASPDDITVQFGIDLSIAAGAVITKTGAGCHFTVTMAWKRSDPGHPRTASERLE